MLGFMWNPAQKLSMTEEQHKTLKSWVAAKTSRPTVIQWRKCFEEQGPQGLAEDAPHGLSSRALDAEKVKGIVEATLHTPQMRLAGLRGRWPKPWG